MVYYMFAMQCMSTVAVMRRETNGWKWPLLQIGYMTGLAYGATFVRLPNRASCSGWEGRMDWQQIASFAIVAVTIVLLIGSEIRRRRRPIKRACGGACDCSEKEQWGQTARAPEKPV